VLAVEFPDAAECDGCRGAVKAAVQVRKVVLQVRLLGGHACNVWFEGHCLVIDVALLMQVLLMQCAGRQRQ
jgi:hypothetical protein